MKKWIACAFLILSFRANAIECVKQADVKPVLVFHSVTSSGSSRIDTADFEKKLRDDLNAGGKFRVVLEDQYRYAKKNNVIDRCTPAYVSNITIENNSVDALPSGLLRGVLIISDYKATVDVKLIEGSVTIDDFSVDGKRISPTTGKSKNSYQNLFDNLIDEFNARQSTWNSGKAPGF